MTFLDSFPIVKRHLEPEEALAALQVLENHRVESFSRTPPVLTRDMTIRSWIGRHDPGWLSSIMQLSGDYWSDVAELLIDHLDPHLPEVELIQVLRRRQATVGELCDFLARHAQIETFSDVNLTGQACPSARLFLTLRARLRCFSHKEITPSSLLPDCAADILRMNMVLGFLAPEICIRPQYAALTPKNKRTGGRFLATLRTSTILLFLSVILFAFPEKAIFGILTLFSLVMLLAVGLLLVAFSNIYGHWEWPGMRSFRDLVRRVNTIPSAT